MRRFAPWLVLVAGCGNGTGPGPPDPGPPNIVLILTDDQTFPSTAVMPSVQSLLVTQGVSFRNFFVTDPLCCPSRASILRGQYVHNHQVLSNEAPNGGFARFLALGHEQSTIATWLRSAGYRTGLFGKYLNGYPAAGQSTHVPPGWDDWRSPVGGSTSSGWAFDYDLNENGLVKHYGSQPADYFTDVLAQRVVAFIRDTSQGDRPFFVYVSTSAPHAPYTPAPRHQAAFAGVTAPRPPSFNEADVSDKPAWVRSLPPLTSSEISGIDNQYRKRLQSLLAIDDLLSGLVDALEEMGELENTFIFFTSDNGYEMGEHRVNQDKGTPYEEDIRVPLIVRGPAVPAGRTLDHFALNLDLAPTFAELAETAAPPFVDGRSLVPLLGPGPPSPSQWRGRFLIELFNPTDRPIPPYYALRTRDTLYVEYATGERELYDLIGDPFELQNQAGSAPPAVLANFSARLAQLKQCAAASCRSAENP